MTANGRLNRLTLHLRAEILFVESKLNESFNWLAFPKIIHWLNPNSTRETFGYPNLRRDSIGQMQTPQDIRLIHISQEIWLNPNLASDSIGQPKFKKRFYWSNVNSKKYSIGPHFRRGSIG